jgi:hypothetical protein
MGRVSLKLKRCRERGLVLFDGRSSRTSLCPPDEPTNDKYEPDDGISERTHSDEESNSAVRNVPAHNEISNENRDPDHGQYQNQAAVLLQKHELIMAHQRGGARLRNDRYCSGRAPWHEVVRSARYRVISAPSSWSKSQQLVRKSADYMSTGEWRNVDAGDSRNC